MFLKSKEGVLFTRGDWLLAGDKKLFNPLLSPHHADV